MKQTKKTGGGSPVWRLIFGLVLALVLGAVIAWQWNLSNNEGPQGDAIREFIHHYFQTWSSKDMTGYSDCFATDAMVYFTRDGQITFRQNKPDFVAGQVDALRSSGSAIEEHPEAITIMTQGKAAYVRVLWKLTNGKLVKRGYDHFILLNTPQGWRIASLTFYEI